MTWPIIIGSLGLAFLSAYIFFKLGENGKSEHFILQLLMIAFIIGSVSTLGGAVYKGTNCHLIPTNATNTNNQITYTYDEVCYSEPVANSDSFVQLTSYYYQFFTTYLILYFIYRVLLTFGYIDKIKTKLNGYKKK